MKLVRSSIRIHLAMADCLAGMWMFTGMSARVAQELGLHRKHASIITSIGRSPVNDTTGNVSVPTNISEVTTSVDLQEYERSSRIILWWCVVSDS